MDTNLSKLLEIVEDRGAWRAAVPDVAVRHNKEWTDCNTDLMDINLSKLLEIVEDRGAWCATVHEVRVRHHLATQQQ